MTDRIPEPALTTKQSMERRLKECAKRWLGQRSQNASLAAVEYFNTMCLELGVADHLSVSQHHVDAYREAMEHRSLSASTINTRLVAVKAYIDHLITYCAACGYPEHATRLASLSFGYKTRHKRPKWHMTDDQYHKAQEALRAICLNEHEVQLVADYMAWTLETGLRVEETLRLTYGDFEFLGTDRPALLVPGTKNEQAGVRIPISAEAAAIITRRSHQIMAGAPRLFDISYERLGRTIWNRLREAMGVQNDPTSTLKALRRNFAVNALRKGLPARIIQELMRHSNIETTMSYLRVIGMSDNDETRSLLNRSLGGLKMDTMGAPPATAKVPGPMPAASTLDLFDTSALEAELIRRKGTSDGQV